MTEVTLQVTTNVLVDADVPVTPAADLPLSPYSRSGGEADEPEAERGLQRGRGPPYLLRRVRGCGPPAPVQDAHHPQRPQGEDGLVLPFTSLIDLSVTYICSTDLLMFPSLNDGQKEGHAGFTSARLCFLFSPPTSPHFLCQIVFLLLALPHLFLFLLLLPTQAGTVGAVWIFLP